MDEKRVDSRHSVNHEFETLGEFVREYVLNVSRGGAFIRSAEVLPVGTAVRVKFTIVDDDILTIEGEGRVARAVCQQSQTSRAWGCLYFPYRSVPRRA